MNKKGAIQKPFDLKFYKSLYGSGKLKTVLKLIGKL
jgi:hypothetical protein